MMTREEKIEKLNTVSVIVTDLTVTFDMGLEFTTMTAKGVTTQMGNIGQWPCFTEKCSRVRTPRLYGVGNRGFGTKNGYIAV